MAQNITIAGASYSAVPSIQVPKTGSGTATFVDTSDADATAAGIMSGLTAYVDGIKLVGTASGGLEYETGSYSPSSNTNTAPTIYFAKEHAEPPAIMVMSDTSTSARAQNYFISWIYINYQKIIKDWAAPSGSNWRSWYNMCSYATSASAENIYSASASTTPMVYKGNFSPYMYGKSMRAGRVYNWIAIWAPDYS